MTIFGQQAGIQTESLKQVFPVKGFLKKNVLSMFLSENQMHCFCLGHPALNHGAHISPRKSGEESDHSHNGSLTLRLTGKLKPFSRGLWNGLWAGGAE